MDHHCPWVDNCIGFYNKKFFMQLIFYFFLTSFCFCINYIPYSIEIIKTIINSYEKGDLNFIYKNFLIILNNIILLGFSILSFNFLKFHIKLISSNLTTIETLDKELMKNKKYDMGFNINFKQVFGDNKLLWFLPLNLPIGYPIGDGLSWPMKEEFINLDNLNVNNNCENNNTYENNNNIISDKKLNKSNSFTRKASNPQTRDSSLNDFSMHSKGIYSKRNSGNYQSNSTRYDFN